MEKLLKRLLTGDGQLSLLLLEAKEFIEESNDEALLNFINSELNGYSSGEIPDYRKIKSEISGTIKDSLGRITHQNHILDFSRFSENMGIDVSTTYFIDGIAFIEENLRQLDGQYGEKPIPYQIVEILNKNFNYNNPRLTLASASYKIGTSAIRFILSKVRQDLIIGLQKLSKQIKITSTIENLLTTNEQIKVFVTYAWENNEHNDKIISLVDFLRKNGYNATMDRKESQEVASINLNQMMIKGIQNSDKVIIVLSQKYKEKADNFFGGVGIEFNIILEELKSSSNKFIFVSLGDSSIANITPTGIKGREVLNLKKDQDSVFNTLFAKLQEIPTIKFSDVGKVVVKVQVKDIGPFRL